MKLIKDYDCTINYHLGKANVVADALSRKSLNSIVCLRVERTAFFQELKDLNVKLEVNKLKTFFAHLRV